MKNIKIFLFTLCCLGYVQNVVAETHFKDYQDFKNYINQQYGFDYNFDVSILEQRSSPNGKNNAVQAYLYPSFALTTFDNQYGTGILNFAYTVIRYGNHNANDLGNNSGFVTPINDYPNDQTEFSELYYTYQPAGNYNWLTIGIGQFPIYNFDGTAYDANQQVNFLNDSLSQNGSASYTQAGLGIYTEISPTNEWSFIIGGQDGTNIDAPSIRFNHLDENHYTTFGSISYTPTIKGVGDSEISLLLYNQPAVTEQPETTNGWSINLSQNIGEKFSVFGRINGVNGNVEEVKQSWVLGGVYNNPLNRNALDQIGLAYAYNKIDEVAVGEPLSHKNEQIIEGYWAWGIGNMLTITPDIQFYINPALNQKSEYGVATSLRATVFF
jgi:hypothetical protein